MGMMAYLHSGRAERPQFYQGVLPVPQRRVGLEQGRHGGNAGEYLPVQYDVGPFRFVSFRFTLPGNKEGESRLR